MYAFFGVPVIAVSMGLGALWLTRRSARAWTGAITPSDILGQRLPCDHL